MKTEFRNIALGIGAAALIAASSPVLAGSGHGHSHDELAQSKDPTIEALKLNDTLTMLFGKDGFTGGNVVVSSGDDGVLIIDDMLASFNEKLSAAIDEVGGTEALKFVVNTHWHFDHVGGNEALGDQATIIAHTNVRKRMSTPQRIDAFDRDIPASPAVALPVITYDEGASLHFNGEEIKLMHMPGSHTDTDTVVYFTKSNVLHMGDIFFNGIFPFIDVQNGGNVKNVLKSVEHVINSYPADVAIVPGHGAKATMDDLKTYRAMLKDTTANVSKMMKAGKSLDDIKAAGVPEKWAKLAWRIDGATFNTIIYNSLK